MRHKGFFLLTFILFFSSNSILAQDIKRTEANEVDRLTALRNQAMEQEINKVMVRRERIMEETMYKISCRHKVMEQQIRKFIALRERVIGKEMYKILCKKEKQRFFFIRKLELALNPLKLKEIAIL